MSMLTYNGENILELDNRTLARALFNELYSGADDWNLFWAMFDYEMKLVKRTLDGELYSIAKRVLDDIGPAALSGNLAIIRSLWKRYRDEVTDAHRAAYEALVKVAMPRQPMQVEAEPVVMEAKPEPKGKVAKKGKDDPEPENGEDTIMLKDDGDG